jgi:hypothetical protein
MKHRSLLMLIVILILGGSLAAQDTPTPEPTRTPSTTFTETAPPTATLTETATDIATAPPAARSTITNFAPTYSTGLVPWVADATTSQQPTPRPFYCTMASANGGSLRFSRHDWYFYRMPDQLTINPSQLYVDPMWSW